MNKREKSNISVISASSVILDIEGTTTSISFVKDKLFPYARNNLEAFLTKNWDSTEIQDVIKDLKLQAKEDEDAKLEAVVSIPEDKEKDVLMKSVIDNVIWQMDSDRKTKGLKDLQGLIWEEGYKKGELKGHIYDDVEPSLKYWVELGKSIYIYSSGSVHAQKLLFGHSEKGDLLPLLKGHFDTSVGKKGDSASYKKILEQISCEPSDTAFLTDVPSEARAAKEAGISAVLLSRDGNAPLTDKDESEFPVVTSFADIEFENNCKKRKLCTENDAENKNKVVEACVVSIEDKNKPHDPKLAASSEVEAMEVDESPDAESVSKNTTEDQGETTQEKCDNTECGEKKEEKLVDVPEGELKEADKSETTNGESTIDIDEQKPIKVDNTNTEVKETESLQSNEVEDMKIIKADEITTNNEVESRENEETTMVLADQIEEDSNAKIIENSETNTAKKSETNTLDEKPDNSDSKTDNEEIISSSNDTKEKVTSSNDVKENISSSNGVEENISSSNDIAENPVKSPKKAVPIEKLEDKKTNADAENPDVKNVSEETKVESDKSVNVVESSDEAKSVGAKSQASEVNEENVNSSSDKETTNIEDKGETTSKSESSNVMPDEVKAKTEAENKPDTSHKEEDNASQESLNDETKVPSIQKTEIIEKESNVEKIDESNEEKNIPNNKADINDKDEKEKEGKQNGSITNGNCSPIHDEKLTNGDEITETPPEGKKCSPSESATLETVVEA